MMQPSGVGFGTVDADEAVGTVTVGCCEGDDDDDAVNGDAPWIEVEGK